jgi:hypothetical protein
MLEYLSDEWLNYAKALIILFFPASTMLIWTHGCRIKKLARKLEHHYQTLDANRNSIITTANFCHTLHKSLDDLQFRVDELEEGLKDAHEAINVLASSLSDKPS